MSDAAGAVPFESVRESIIESQTTEKQSEAYQKFLADLKEGADIVLYTDRLEIFNR